MNVDLRRLRRIAPVEFYDGKELYFEGMEKVLSLSAVARTLSAEVEGSELRLNYLLTLKVTYLDEGGIVEVREESEERSTSLRCSLKGESPLVKLEVRGVEHALSNVLKVRVSLEASGVLFEGSSLEVLEDSGLTVKKKVERVKNTSKLKCVEKALIGTIPCDLSTCRLLANDCQITLKKVSTATDICEIEGTMQISLTTMEAGEIAYKRYPLPFKEDLLFEGVRDGDEAVIFVDLVSLSLSGSGEESEVGALVSFNGYVVKDYELELPVDAFSKENETALEENEAILPTSFNVIEEKERFSETLPLDGIEDAVEILSVSPPYFGACSLSESGDAVVEGVLCIELLVKSESESYNRCALEWPFSFKLSSKLECTTDLPLNLSLVDFSVRLRFGSSVEISGEIKIELECLEEGVVRCLKGVNYLGAREPSDAVISVYLVGEGETLFDCAKALVSDEEELLSLNPELTLPLKEGDKVLLYRPL